MLSSFSQTRFMPVNMSVETRRNIAIEESILQIKENSNCLKAYTFKTDYGILSLIDSL